MAYVDGNPKTKKALKQLLEEGEVTIFQPGGWFPLSPDVVKGELGYTVVEGPHNPEPHRWYACVEYNLATSVVTRIVENREMTKIYRG